MSNILTFSRTTGSSERPAMNHTLASTDFTADKTINVTGKITSIVYNFIFKYTGTSNPSWTGYASIVTNDGTEYQGTSLTQTITHSSSSGNVLNYMSLTIPEANCPPASVINSKNFNIKLTTTACSKDPYVPAESDMSIVITYDGAQSYIYSSGNTVTVRSPVEYANDNLTQATGRNFYGVWIAITSSSYSASYPPHYMFSNTSTSWASKAGTTTGGDNTVGRPYNQNWLPCIILTLPKGLSNITVKITNRVPQKTGVPVAGPDYVYCYAYDALLGGSTILSEISELQAYAVADYKGTGSNALLKIDNRSNASIAGNILTCNFNNSTPYEVIGLACPAVCRSSDKYWAIGELSISGYAEYNGWVPATPYIYNGSTWVPASASYVFA